MQAFTNPFRKRDASTLPGVPIPLENVPRDKRDEHRTDDNSDGESDDAPLLPDDNVPADGVNAELERELDAAENDTPYERTCRPRFPV